MMTMMMMMIFWMGMMMMIMMTRIINENEEIPYRSPKAKSKRCKKLITIFLSCQSKKLFLWGKNLFKKIKNFLIQ